MRCSYCGVDGHPSTCCPANGTSSRLRCTYCGGTDHNYEACVDHWGGGKMPGAIRLQSAPTVTQAMIASAIRALRAR